MLTGVEIKNFRCLRDVTAPLRPLTVLIGENDSGKSAFLAAVERLSRNIGFNPGDFWRMDKNSIPRIVGAAGETVSFLAEHPQALRADPEDARGLLEPCGVYDLPSSGVEMRSAGQSDDAGAPQMGSKGQGVPALLDYMLRRDRQRFFAIISALQKLVPGFEELEIATPDPNTRRVDLVIEEGLRIPAVNASSGVRLLLFFVALAYHPDPPKLILIEEPENGVHPRRLGDVIRLLREITQGKHGHHAAQVILTTHSPHLLDYIDIKTDQVLVFSRNDDGSRKAEPADAKRLENFLDEFMLGEVWYNEGEAGLVRRDT